VETGISGGDKMAETDTALGGGKKKIADLFEPGPRGKKEPENDLSP